jgi:hypothetical protein
MNCNLPGRTALSAQRYEPRELKRHLDAVYFLQSLGQKYFEDIPSSSKAVDFQNSKTNLISTCIEEEACKSCCIGITGRTQSFLCADDIALENLLYFTEKDLKPNRYFIEFVTILCRIDNIFHVLVPFFAMQLTKFYFVAQTRKSLENHS